MYTVTVPKHNSSCISWQVEKYISKKSITEIKANISYSIFFSQKKAVIPGKGLKFFPRDWSCINVTKNISSKTV